MVQIHSDKSVPRHPPRSTTLDSANTSRNNIQHDLLASPTPIEEPTDGTSNGEAEEAPTQERRFNGQRSPFQRQNNHTRSQFSAQENLDMDAVNKIESCEACQRKKTKCRHTVRPFSPASDTSVPSVSTSSHHSSTIELCQRLEQASSTPATRPARGERHVKPSFQSTAFESMLSDHISETTSLAQYLNDPETFSLIPALEDPHATLRRDSIVEALHTIDQHFPPNSPTDQSLDPLLDNEHWRLHGTFNGSDDTSATERIMNPSAAEHRAQPPIPWHESQLGYTQPLSQSQVSYTGSQFDFSLDHISPPQGFVSLADSPASTQCNGWARRARGDFERGGAIDDPPV